MEEYKYSWKPSSELSVDKFLQKGPQYKPTMVVDDGTKPWIWVRRLEHEPLDSVDTESADSKGSDIDGSVIKSAHKLLEDYTEKIASIQKDESIPVRANKKKGLRSKKEVREEVATEAAEKFKQLSQESKLTCGKLLFFIQADQIDGAFSRMAHDLVTGALSKTPAFCLKVATTPADVLPNHRYLICLYLPDLYDKAAVTEVLRTVCQSTGIRPNSAKADLYTLIGLDSKHPSGIKSTIWNPTDLVPDAELKALTDAYWSEATKKAVVKEPASTSKSAESSKKKVSKRPRKQEPEDGAFDEVEETNSDDATNTTQDMVDQTKKKSQGPPPKVAPSKAQTDDSATESESDEELPSKPTTALATSKPGALRTMKQVNADDSSDEDTKKPKKIRRF
ncbi:unnamed protein product [Rhizoctonia solani]|uniref:Uncharacterized protein n=1 Tax=Rhizoctonia solani TaxID=456999 RepID=A0A8H3CIY3_9AGAM|nr:unnamed protein product [Rhizoctonia solani]